MYWQLIPAKVLKILPEVEDKMKQITGYNIDNLKQILSIISVHVRKDDNGHTPLKMAFLVKAVPQANEYMKQLIDFGIIERTGSYQIGITAYKYRFTPEYISRYETVVLDNPKLMRRIDRYQGEMKKHSSKKYPGQNEYIRSVTMAPGWESAIENIPDIESYNYAKSSATRIINGDIYYTTDSTSGRLHHNVTNMPKVLRPYLRVNGQPMTEIDVSNCQPYLSTLLLSSPGKAAPFAKYSKFALILESLQVSQSEDVKRYASLVIKGEFYEYFRDEYNKKEGTNKTRDDAKDMMLQILFDRNSHISKGRKAFQELFPEVDRVFKIVRGYEKGDKFRSFERFSILLQTVEAYIINEQICKRINSEYPGVITVTIYDSIMTAIFTNDVQIVSKVMREEFKKVVGYEPKLKKPRVNLTIKKKEEGEREGEGKTGGNMILEPLYLDEYQYDERGQSLNKISYKKH